MALEGIVLENRTELRKKSAESLTDPAFLALTSLNNTVHEEFLPLKATIRHIGQNNGRMRFRLQRIDDTLLEYRINYKNRCYVGCVSEVDKTGELVTDAEGNIVSHATIRTINGNYVRNSNGTLQCVTTNKHVPVDQNDLKQVHYWIHTVINRFARDADHFIQMREQSESGNPPAGAYTEGGNSYWFDYKTQTCHSEADGLEITLHASPEPHFRKSFFRNLSTGQRTLVTGTFVNTNWKEFAQEQILAKVERNAREIIPSHFYDTILPRMSEAGHSAERIAAAYEAGRR